MHAYPDPPVRQTTAAERSGSPVQSRMNIAFPAILKRPRFQRRLAGISAVLVPLAGWYRFSSDFVSVLSAFLFFFMLPGLCIGARLFRENTDLLERTACAFTCGMAFNALFFLIRGVVGFPSDFVATARILAACICLVVLVTVRHEYKNHWAGFRFRTGDSALVPLILIAVLGMILLFNENVWLLTSDSLAYLPRMVEWGRQGETGIDPTAELVTLLGNTRLYRMVMQPFLLQVTAVAPAVSYQILTVLVGGCFACSFYFFLKRLWDDKLFLTLGILLFITHFGGFWFNPIHSNYSWFVAWSLYFIAMGRLLEASGSGEKKKAILPLVLIGITVLFHGAVFLMAVLSTSAFLFGILALGDHLNRGLRKIVAGALSVLFIGTLILYGIDVLWTRLPLLDSLGLYRTRGFGDGFVEAFGSGYVIDPVSGPVLFSGLWGLLSVAFLPIVFRNRNRLKKNAASFLGSNTVVPLAVLFNPLLVSVLLPWFQPAGVERLIFAMPYIPVTVLVVTVFLRKRQNAPADAAARGRAVGIVLLVLITGLPVFLYRGLLLLPADWGTRVQPLVERISGLPTGPYRYNHPALLRAMDFIKRKIPTDALFLTDPLTAELFPIRLKQPVLERWRRDPTRLEIPSSTSMIALGSNFNIRKTVALLTDRRVDFILINDSWNAYTSDQYFEPPSEGIDSVFDVGKFKAHPEFFRLLFEDGRIFLFEFLGRSSSGSA